MPQRANYFWCTRWPARALEEANCRRKGILHLMCEAKPMFALGAALGVAPLPDPPEGPDTDCRHCSHFVPDVPSEIIEELERAGVSFPTPRRSQFMCDLSLAPMTETRGKCRSFSQG
jgi:hypothetical protein